jgi:CRP/FNR family cyclic AMP-dependent transcriptional regulator
VREALLKEMPSLASRLAPGERDAASRSLTVAVMDLRPGRWDAPKQPRPGHLGFLVLEGVVLREVCITRDWSAEMLGEGDVLRPWVEDGSSFVRSRWEILERTRLAVLDPAAAAQICNFPALLDDLFERAIKRSRSLAVHATIEGVHRIDQRLLLLFWHLAEQWGKRTQDGVVVPIRLAHGQLARLVGARRPTVTTALGKLERTGELKRTHDQQWLLSGDPPQPGEFE